MRRLFILLFVGPLASMFAQVTYQSLSNFDKIELGSDSVVTTACNIRKNKKEGFAIEFDSKGDPYSIGKYHRGRKKGLWYFANGTSCTYKKGKSNWTAMPGCNTGATDSRQNFKDFYSALTDPKNKKKIRRWRFLF